MDNDVYSGNCALRFKGGWWYTACHASNLNGLYLGGAHQSYATITRWKKRRWKWDRSLRTSIFSTSPAAVAISRQWFLSYYGTRFLLRFLQHVSPVLLSSRKVLVLEDPREPIFKFLSLSSSSSSKFKCSKIFRGLSRLSVSALCAGVSAWVAMT